MLSLKRCEGVSLLNFVALGLETKNQNYEKDSMASAVISSL